jgi:hypothetical protein
MDTGRAELDMGPVRRRASFGSLDDYYQQRRVELAD